MDKPMTAYEQSVQAAHEMHEAARHERERQEQAAQDLQMHKQAFRVAFDILAQNWPPENTVDYWQPVAERFTKAFNEYGTNPLAKKLLLAVYEYLNDTGRIITDGIA